MPGNIQLLPEYVHTTKRGIDTQVGEIAKPTGLIIRYDIGSLAGNYALGMFNREKENVAWFKTQTVNGQSLIITRGKDGSIVATFPGTCANFISGGAKDEETAADFIIMIMTYREKVERKKTPVNIWERGC